MDDAGQNPADYEVKLEIFEGPLDLLLHLIRKNEVDIFDIPIAVITDQYLQYLDMMKALNVSVAGDFLVMASTLVHIKSRMLLPNSGEDDEEEDPRDEITRPLLEYLRLKELANELSERPILGRDVFARLSSADPSNQFEGEGPLLRVNLFQLMDAFKRILEQRAPSTQIHFQAEEWSIKERMEYILETLRGGQARTFTDLFVRDRTVSELVATFLAVLEMVQMGLVRVYQTDSLSDIRIELNPDEEQGDG